MKVRIMANSHRLDHQPFVVSPATKIQLKDYETDYTAGFADKKAAEKALLEDVSELAGAQNLLWASKDYAVIILFQALDAAGKDGTIKHVMSGVNPQGVNVHSFKAPSEEERLHHFLWRPMRVMPARGMIAIFNRSYYEEVLVVRVHPEFLDSQWLPQDLRKKDLTHLWHARYDEINAFEKAMSDQNVVFLKFFLNVSKKEQRKRFLERLDDSEKNWKFSLADLRERALWDEYQQAYEHMLNATSTEWAPWHIIPADKKWFARACVADIITNKIRKLNLKFPTVNDQEKAALAEGRRALEAEGND
jgi:PPK2 family polyphosphate:nucleotide phosphotransferase